MYLDETLSFCLDDGSMLSNISQAKTELFETPTVVRYPLDTKPTDVHLTAKETNTSLGLKSNTAAFICYLPICGFGQLLAIFFLFSERKNSFVRFHALQSLSLPILISLLWLITSFIIINFIGPRPGDLATGVLMFVLYGCPLIILVLSIFIGIAALRGEKVKIPILGQIASYLSDSQND